MNQDIFHLVGIDEADGKRESARGSMRLVCRIKGGGKLAIWGSSGNTTNIDLVLQAGFPCTINCQWREPSSWAMKKYGHTHWVPEHADSEVTSSYFKEKQAIRTQVIPCPKPAPDTASSEPETGSCQPSQADRIRQYAFQHYIQPARKAGKGNLSIRIGDIASEMGLNERIPAVCSALRTRKFLELAEVELLKTSGPLQSTTTEFYYAIGETRQHGTTVQAQTVSEKLKGSCGTRPETGNYESLPAIGTYWYGPALGPLERACLISMMEQGHSVTLFCHEKVGCVPDGVETCDAREVTGDRPVLFFENSTQKGNAKSPALFTDLFRYHMIDQTGMVWLDLDAYLLKPLRMPKHGYIFAWDRKTIAGGVLALPHSSASLKDLVSFCENEYPVPPFFSYVADRKARLLFMRAIGRPVHVSRQKWGVWGPRALTWFLTRNHEDHYALETRLLYPIDWRDPSPFFLPSDEVKESYLKDAVSVHLFGSQMREKIKETGSDKTLEGSYLQELIRIGDQ